MQTNKKNSNIARHQQQGTVDVTVQLLLVMLNILFVVLQSALAPDAR